MSGPLVSMAGGANGLDCVRVWSSGGSGTGKRPTSGVLHDWLRLQVLPNFPLHPEKVSYSVDGNYPKCVCANGVMF